MYFGTLPSKTQTFQSLAEAIESGDPSRYRPTERPNVDPVLWLER